MTGGEALLAAETFEGGKPGCVFRTGDSGTGYYRAGYSEQQPVAGTGAENSNEDPGADCSDSGSDYSDWDELDEDDFLPQETESRPEEDRSCIFEDRLDRGTGLKEEANKLLQSGDALRARRVYKRAYYHVDFDELQTWDMQDKHKAMIVDAQLPIVLNMAQASLKLSQAATVKKKLREKEARSCLAYCKKALELREGASCAKAMYRRALALEQLDDMEDAMDAMKQAKVWMHEEGTAPDKMFEKNMKRVKAKAKIEHEHRKTVRVIGGTQRTLFDRLLFGPGSIFTHWLRTATRQVWKGKLPPPMEPEVAEAVRRDTLRSSVVNFASG
jgi:hypothetical protein